MIRYGGPGTNQTWKCKKCGKHKNHGKKIPKKQAKLEYNYSLGYIIGVILGDGSMGKSKDYWYFNDKNQQVPKAQATRIIPRYRHLFQLQVIDKDFTEEYAKHIKILMGKTTKPYLIKNKPVTEIAGNKLKKPYSPTIYKVQFSSEEWYHILKPLLENFDWLKNANREVKRGFLVGLYDSEGGAHPEKYRIRVHLTNKNRDLLELVRGLLKEYEIESGIYLNSQNIYRLSFGKRAHVNIFANNLGFSIKRKQNILGK